MASPEQAAGVRRVLPPAVMLAAIAGLHLRYLVTRLSAFDLWAFSFDAYTGATNLLQVKEFFSTGIIPLWTPHNVMGTPLIGLYLATLLNPLVELLLHFSFGTSFGLLAAAHSLLVAFFSYLLSRRAGASPWGSAVAGFLCSMTGFIAWVTPLYPVIAPLPWLLCWLWSAMGILERPLLRRWLINVAAIALLLGGDAQIAVQGAYLFGLWLILYGWLSLRRPKTLARHFVPLVLAAVAGFLLASAQMIPAILYFDRAVSIRTPSLTQYASTYPHLYALPPAGLMLFSRLARGLFLPLSTMLLFAAALTRNRRNPALLTTLIVAAAVAIVVMLGRSGLAFIPFHLPLLKSFIRHYKYGLMLQGPLFIGVALGFDLLPGLLRDRKAWQLAAMVILTFSAILVQNLFFSVVMVALALILILALRRQRLWVLPALLFALLLADAGGTLWKTPFALDLPRPDPIYPEFVKKLGPNGRVLGMYPWMVRSRDEFNQPIPTHGTGHYDDYSIDSWLEFPIKTHAYLLDAICPEVARIEHGEFSHVDFTTCFKSTDWINDRNRHLVNLVGLRYLFLQDSAISAADRFPILLDPAHTTAPEGLEKRFAPWWVVTTHYFNRQLLPQLRGGNPGRFIYRHAFRTGDRFSGRVQLSSLGMETVVPGQRPSWTQTIASAGGRQALIYARSSFPTADTEVSTALPEGSDGSLSFVILPGDSHPFATWINPEIVNPSRTIKYRGGDRVMVFENTEALGRARVVHRAMTARTVEDAYQQALEAKTFDPRSETILIGATVKAEEGPAPTSAETVTVSAPNTSMVAVRAQLDSPGFLVLADTYFPGWRALDETGHELRIHLADISLRAVRLPAGDHRVTFVYQPLDFKVGLWVTTTCLFSFAVAVMAGIFSIQRRKGSTKE